MGEVIALKKKFGTTHKTISEFIWDGNEGPDIPPDGPLKPASLYGDFYLLECARHIRRKGLSNEEAIAFFARKRDQLFTQIHFSIEEDRLIIDRLAHWTRELSE